MATFFYILLYYLFKCRSYGKKDYGHVNMVNMNKFELLFSIPWGNAVSEIRPRIRDVNIFSESYSDKSHKIYSPVSFRLDRQSGIHMLNSKDNPNEEEDDYIIRFNDRGKFENNTKIPQVESVKQQEIIDFAVDDKNNYYLIEKLSLDKDKSESNKYKLSKIDEKGNVIWEHIGIENKKAVFFDTLEGEFNKILLDSGSNIYLTSKNEFKAIGRFDGENGRYIETKYFENGSNQIYINRSDKILRVVYLKDLNRRGLSYFDHQTSEENLRMAGIELFGKLLFSFGFDDKLNCYIYNEPKLIKIPFQLDSISLENIKSLCTFSKDDTTTIFTNSYLNERAFFIDGYTSNDIKQEWELNIPEKIILQPTDDLRLIKVDEFHKFYILKKNSQSDKESILVFSDSSQFVEEIFPSNNWTNIETNLQNYQYWQIDSKGRIYFPLTTPEGFKLIRMNYFKCLSESS